MWVADALSNDVSDDCCPSVDQYIIYNMGVVFALFSHNFRQIYCLVKSQDNLQ